MLLWSDQQLTAETVSVFPHVWNFPLLLFHKDNRIWGRKRPCSPNGTTKQACLSTVSINRLYQCATVGKYIAEYAQGILSSFYQRLDKATCKGKNVPYALPMWLGGKFFSGFEHKFMMDQNLEKRKPMLDVFATNTTHPGPLCFLHLFVLIFIGHFL